MNADREIVVLITAPDQETAQEIATDLVKKRLAACVNLISPVQSIYSWEGDLHKDEEILLLVKTRQDLFENQLLPAVKARHPYQLPEVIALPILVGSAEYLGWIRESTR